MTYGRSYALRLDLDLASGGSDFATYDSFKINSESNSYYSYLTGSLRGDYSTTNCLRYMSYRSFTTLDRDHDSYTGVFQVTCTSSCLHQSD
ncbi:Angiopoietin-related protein 2 [Portunus trituberculatus]|uniref:Angiopoietin-related protein 2 n=1 Tax=Portunus trituberculatus TaxID=210409 RepID=A0A5B7K393_PORTR|nr:Angiopoietin-related protein 2 [Portunus trituberculatus]